MRCPASSFQSAAHSSSGIVESPGVADQVALPRDERPGARSAVEVVDVDRQVRVRQRDVVTSTEPSCPSPRGERRRAAAWRPSRRRTFAVGVVLAAAGRVRLGGVGVAAGAQRGRVRRDVGRRPLGLRAPLAVVGLDGERRVGHRRRDALEEAAVEAHDLVEPARAAHLQRPTLVRRSRWSVAWRTSRCRARAPTGPSQAALVAGVVVEVLLQPVGDRVVLGQALGEEQRHLRARGARDQVAQLPEVRVVVVVAGLRGEVLRQAGRVVEAADVVVRVVA